MIGWSGRVKAAHLTAVLAADTGLVLAYDVTSGPPATIEVLSILSLIPNLPKVGDQPRTVAASRGLARTLAGAPNVLNSLRLQHETSSGAIAPGDALGRIFGLRIGKVPLLRDRPAEMEVAEGTGMQLIDVRSIIAVLIDELNCAILRHQREPS